MVFTQNHGSESRTTRPTGGSYCTKLSMGTVNAKDSVLGPSINVYGCRKSHVCGSLPAVQAMRYVVAELSYSHISQTRRRVRTSSHTEPAAYATTGNLGANSSAEFCASALPAFATRRRETNISYEGPRAFGNETGEGNSEQTSSRGKKGEHKSR
jgi:hypothetical protein